MMKILLLSIMMFCTAEIVIPQCYFHKTYDYDTRGDGGTVIIQTSDGGLLSVGDADIITNNEEGTYCIKTDECGNKLWTSFNILSPGTGGEAPWAVFENLEDNTFTLLGNMYDHSEGASSSFIFKLSSNGDSLYHQIIDHGYNDWCRAALKNNNNEYILGGNYNLSPPDKLIFLSKVDSLGNIIWQYDYGNPVDGYALKNLDRTKDGGYILSGYMNYGPSGATGALYLMKTDSAGNKQWEEHYPNTYYQGHVLSTSDGGFLLVGNNKPANNVYHGYVGKMDSAGNVLWQKYFDQPDDPGAFVNAKEVHDGNYLITGSASKAAGGNYTYLAKISQQDGGVIWERRYDYFGGETHNYMYDLIITREGDIAGTGFIIPIGIINSTDNDMFILKVDSCGYLESDSLEANFSCSADTVNNIVSFYNESIGYCTSYWSFGNGDSSNAAHPEYSYSDTGAYTITLVVRAGNTTDTITQTINTSECISDQDVNAQFEFEQDPNDIYSFSFTNQSQKYCNLQWHFGDSNNNTVPNPSHTYSDTGTYTITLIAYAGAYSDTFTREIKIEEIGVGIPQFTTHSSSFIIYPNPNDGRMVLEYDLSETSGHFQMYDLQGKFISNIRLTKGSHKLEIEQQGLSNGTYLYRISSKGRNLHHGKVVIIK